MTISIWRYSHLLLAIISSLFLLVASITGVILAVEPVAHQAKSFDVRDLEKVSLATTLEAVKSEYDEVFSLEVESSGFVKASVLTADFETANFYIDPVSGKALGVVQERPAIYNFATNLHRSLFLKSVGRFFVGFVSLLLILIAVSGTFLLVQRQGGIRRVFSKVQKDYFELRYHVILSRLLLIPILIVAITGVYLSAEKFNLLPEASVTHTSTTLLPNSDTSQDPSELKVFKNITLSSVRSVDFPFSDDPEDYYQIALKDKEIRVNGQTGEVMSSVDYPFVALASRYSLMLHTGEGNVLWSLVLLLASASILFFMYSGFVMSLKRLKKSKHLKISYKKEDSEYVILVGSETGTAYEFANKLFKSLTSMGKAVYITELNNYAKFEKAKHLIVVTSTYGDGDAPTNARKFETNFGTIEQPNNISYSVVGLGSTSYPHFCEFAIKVDSILQQAKGFHPSLPLHKINNGDASALSKWTQEWSKEVDLPIQISSSEEQLKEIEKMSFTVVERTEINLDDTFLLLLKPNRNTKFTSGDLLCVFPEETGYSRQYSIAKIGNNILLSIKRHKFGTCSSYLSKLEEGDQIMASIEHNHQFHFPKKGKSVVLIANGTGIAPFLGMLVENKTTTIHLFWGGRTLESGHIYSDYFNRITTHNNSANIHKCYSREENGMYVQDLITQKKDVILNCINASGTIMICGSLAMQNDVLDALEEMLISTPDLDVESVKRSGRLLMDCY